jgi:hypothetical protein
MVVVGATLIGCSDKVDPPGADARAFADATALLAALRSSGIECDGASPFDSMAHVSPDSIDYPIPEGLLCTVDDDEMYLLVYEEQDDRVDAIEWGPVNSNLCALTQIKPNFTTWGLSAVVGANWRIATLGIRLPVIDQVLAAFEGADSEHITCEFEA